MFVLFSSGHVDQRIRKTWFPKGKKNKEFMYQGADTGDEDRVLLTVKSMALAFPDSKVHFVLCFF